MGLRKRLRPWAAGVLVGACSVARAGGAPEFSYMTLNGITQVTSVLEGFSTELEGAGFRQQAFATRLAARLAEAGLEVVSEEAARTLPGAAQVRLRLVVNKDPHGIYFYGVKLLVRQKIPLGNAAGGFVSQVVWSDGQSGALQFGEGGKSLRALDTVLDGLLQDYRQQNAGGR